MEKLSAKDLRVVFPDLSFCLRDSPDPVAPVQLAPSAAGGWLRAALSRSFFRHIQWV
jgi:hypothetical protein